METREPVKGATWFNTDYPVLLTAAELCMASSLGNTTCEAIATKLDVDKGVVVAAVGRLANIYLEVSAINMQTSRDFLVTGLTRDGLVAADVWPSADAVQQRFVAALEELIANTPAGSPKASKLEGVLGAVRDLTTGTGSNIFGQLITSALGA